MFYILKDFARILIFQKLDKGRFKFDLGHGNSLLYTTFHYLNPY